MIDGRAGRLVVQSCGMLMVLAGCTVGPHYREPVQMPVAIADVPTPQVAAPTNWWVLFGDPILDTLITRSGEGNLDLRQAVARVRAARALFDDAERDLVPRVTSGAGYARSKSQRPGQTTDRVTVEQADLGFDASWEIDLFGRVRHEVESAGADAEAARFDADNAKVIVTAEVVRNYLLLRGAQARRGVAQENARTQTETLRLTQVQVDAGRGDPVDVHSARARLEATRAKIPIFTIAELHAGYRLAVLLGQRPGSLDGELVAQTEPVMPMAREVPLGEVSSFLRRRPDVQAAERRLAAQTARVGVATADLFPRIRVTGFVGLLTGDVSSLFKGGSGAWSVAPSVSWPALDLGGARARLRAQQAESDVSLAAYDQAVLLAIEDLQGALVAYRQRQLQVLSLAAQVDAARQAARLANIRYKEGDIDFLRVLDADRTKLDAEDGLTAARVEANTDVVAIYKALGGY